MRYLLPLLLTAVAFTVTYFTCMRPMRRGQGCHLPGRGAGSTDPESDAEIERLRAEVGQLRAELTRRGQAAAEDPTRP